MKVLISGATGFVGSLLAKRLASKGERVSALSRNADTAIAQLPRGTPVFAWNPAKEPPSPESLESVDAVVHLAGESVVGRWTEAKKQAIRDSRVLSTRNLVGAFRKGPHKPQTLICASAIGYYGDRGEEELLEDSAPGDDFLAETCVEWEKAAEEAEALGIRVVRLRIGLVLDRGGGALQAMLPAAWLGLGGPLGPGDQWWPWISREDVAGLIAFALDHDISGPVNAVSREPERQVDFARVLGRVLRRPAFLPAPAFALRLILGEFASELLSSKRVLPGKAERAGYSFQHDNIEYALRDVLGR